MKLFLIGFAAYWLGCALTMVFFMVGRTPTLNERNWPWPVVFLWPLLALWPIHLLAGLYIRRRIRRQKHGLRRGAVGN